MENQTTATHSRQCYLMIHSWSRLSPGILVIGCFSRYSRYSVEFWSPFDPEEGSCQLNDYPRYMDVGSTVNLISSCLLLRQLWDSRRQAGGWRAQQLSWLLCSANAASVPLGKYHICHYSMQPDGQRQSSLLDPTSSFHSGGRSYPPLDQH